MLLLPSSSLLPPPSSSLCVVVVVVGMLRMVQPCVSNCIFVFVCACVFYDKF